MVNGTLPVQGEGIVLTVANPLSVSGDNADLTAKRKWQPGSSRHRFRFAAACLLAMAIRSGGDRDQRQPPWRANSIRTAGSTILIGVNSVQSPYRIEAIGNQATLAKSVSKTTQKQLYDDFKKAGIYPQISKANRLHF